MKTNNYELDNLIDLFSNFYKAIIVNDPEKEKLQANLHEFIETFYTNDANFHKTHDFLRRIKEEKIDSFNILPKKQELLKNISINQTSKPKPLAELERFTSEDYSDHYNEIMDEIQIMEGKYKLQDVNIIIKYNLEEEEIYFFFNEKKNILRVSLI